MSDEILKLSDPEHVLRRPDTYIGSAKLADILVYVLDPENRFDQEDDDDDDESTTESKETSKKSRAVIKRCGSFTQRELKIVPGFVKIFDEVITNASDHYQRNKKTCTTIKVTADPKTGRIVVWNNGPGISSKKNAKYDNIPGPTLIFGHFRTGTNFDDSKERTWGGRNGLGVKLTNVWSTEFVVETVHNKVKFRQEWTSNMSHIGEPVIEASESTDYTKVSFIPDYQRFGLKKGLTNDILAVLQKRVYDLAGIFSDLNVSWNQAAVKISSFPDYCNMYMSNSIARGRFEFSDKSKTWQVIVAFNPEEIQQSISFVNGLNTEDGGTHVDHVLDVIVPHLIDGVKAALSDKSLKVTSHMIKSTLSVYVAALIPNPSFHSQTKTKLVTDKHDFTPFLLTDAAIKKLKVKTEGSLLANVISVVERRHGTVLAKTDAPMNKNVKIDKLEDAKQAGKAHAERCTLILTEGDSAKALAMAGLTVVGQEYYGVFPLRGKFLNVRSAKLDKLKNSKEFINLKRILGLKNAQDGKPQKLRYGRIMIATDADSDGHHIAGLILNMIDYFWPECLQQPEYLSFFRTPIVKVWPKHKQNKLSQGAIWFYTDAEYKKWQVQHPELVAKYDHKQYKGLGTSSPAEAKEYFQLLDSHQIPLLPIQPDERKHIDMCFHKAKANQRKTWIQEGSAHLHEIPDFRPSLSGRQFLDERVLLHSIENCERMIPSVMDGLKIVQRKILWLALQKSQTKPMKVGSFGGLVISKMAYHHGEAALNGAIIEMASNYIGSNNLNVLVPEGQFGTRAEGGKDAASPRYIFTRLSPLARFIFRAEDDGILNFLTDDGKVIEPEFLLPIVPMLLVNGSYGIGTGFQSIIPAGNIYTLIAMLKERLLSKPKPQLSPSESKQLSIKTESLDDGLPIKTEIGNGMIGGKSPTGGGKSPTIGGKSPTIGGKSPTASPSAKKTMIYPRITLPATELQPSFRGFLGTVEYEKETNRFFCCGNFTVEDVGSNMKRILITEIPIEYSFAQYEDTLQALKDKSNRITSFEKVLLPYDDHVHFEVLLTVQQFDFLKLKQFAPLKLQRSIRVNCTAWNEKRAIVKYGSLQEVFDTYFDLRLPFYTKRKEVLLKEYRSQQTFLRNKARFIQCIIEEKITLNVDEHLVYDVLEEMGFDQIHSIDTKGIAGRKTKLDENDDDQEQDQEEKERKGDEKETEKEKGKVEKSDRKRGYWYLLKIPMIQQTEGHYKKLLQQCKQIDDQIIVTESKSIQTMWIEELDELHAKLKASEKQQQTEKDQERFEAAKKKKPSKSSYQNNSSSFSPKMNVKESKVKIVPKTGASVVTKTGSSVVPKTAASVVAKTGASVVPKTAASAGIKRKAKEESKDNTQKTKRRKIKS